MFGLDKNSDIIYYELLYKALSIASFRELGDSSIKEIYNTTFDTTNITTPFIGNIGKMSNGLNIRIPEADSSSYNILTSFVLSMEPRSYEEISASHHRFGNNKESVFIYINGLKVPDSKVHMYLTSSHTNFIIPKIYFKSGENEIFIEKRKFDNFTYGGTYINDFNNDVIIFNVSEHRNLIVNDNTTLVFINGKYIPKIPYGNISFITYENNQITIKFNKNFQGRVEVFIDSTSKYISTKNITGNSSIVPFYIDNEFIDPIYGPINKDNCSFFVNGERIDNKNIEQKGRLHFTYNKTISSDDNFSIIFSDKGKIDIKSFKLYGNDYFLYNLIGSQNITNKLLGPETGSITMHPDDISNINYQEALHSNEYSYDEIINIKNNLDSISDSEVRIQELLRRCPYLLKDFLELFASKTITKTIEYNGEPEITIGVGLTHETGTKVIRIVIVNGSVAKIDKFIVSSISFSYREDDENIEKNPYWNTVIDGSWFQQGENNVEIIESTSNSNHKVYKVVKIDRYDTIYNEYDYRAVCDVFGTITDIDDFDMMAITKREFDKDGIYLDDNVNYGFKKITAPKFIIDGKIYVSFGPNDPKIDMFIIMMNKHHDHISVQLEENESSSYNSLFSGLYCGIERYYDNNEYHDVKIPIIHNGAFIVSNDTDGTRLFHGLDFTFKTLSKTSNIRLSGIIFHRKFIPNTKINVVLTPEYTSSDKYVSMSCDNTGPNKYALLYLNKLKFPFSPKYVKVFANNKNLLEKDIDILSDKLIRLHSIETLCSDHEEINCPNCILGGSLHNVYVEFAFKASFTQLDPFIIGYGENEDFDSDFEKELGKIFAPYYIVKPKEIANNIIDEDAITTVNSIYESLNINVDSNYKTPNTIISGSFLSNKYNIYADVYLRWFISTKSDHIWKSFKDIPEEVLKELLMFKIINDNNYDVVVRPEVEDLISDIEISSNIENYPGYTVEGTVKNFLNCCLENEISIQECYNNYENYEHSTIVYKRDLLPISAIQFFDGEDIIVGRTSTFKIENE